MKFAQGPRAEVTRSPEREGVMSIGKDAETKSPELFNQIIDFVGDHFEVNAVNARSHVVNLLKKGGHIYYVLDRGKIIAIGGTQPDSESGPSGARELRRGIGFNLAAVHPDHRKVGIYSQINEARIDEALRMRAAFIYTDTQNPVVEFSFKNALNSLVKRKVIKGFSFERKLSVGGMRRKFTRERPGTSGNPEIDTEYAKLKIDEGEMYQLYFNLEYPN